MGKSIFADSEVIESGWNWSPVQWGWHSWKLEVLDDISLAPRGAVRFIQRGPYWATIYREYR